MLEIYNMLTKVSQSEYLKEINLISLSLSEISVLKQCPINTCIFAYVSSRLVLGYNNFLTIWFYRINFPALLFSDEPDSAAVFVYLFPFSFKFTGGRVWASNQVSPLLDISRPSVLRGRNGEFSGIEREALENMCCSVGPPVGTLGTVCSLKKLFLVLQGAALMKEEDSG